MKKIILLNLLFFLSCLGGDKEQPTTEIDDSASKEAFHTALREHLDAVEKKDSIALQATMSPDGEFFFLLGERPRSTKSKSFMDFHSEWFKSTGWNIKFKIIETKVDERLGFAITECLYTEPERDGKPYFNKLHVTYVQEKIDDKWYVILDQATSFEKSTAIDSDE